MSFSGHVNPISSLSPYHKNRRWVIKARVFRKSDVRRWRNSNGEGQVFHFDLIDESGEIRCVAFRDMVDKYYTTIEVDKVYHISNSEVKIANKRFNNTKNIYEIIIDSHTVIAECQGGDCPSSLKEYSFTDIKTVSTMEPNQTVDVIGVAKSISETQGFYSRSLQRKLRKREIQLIDQSNATITLTLWGSQAENFDGTGHPVIFLKGAKIGEFGGGKTLSVTPETVIRLNPKIEKCLILREWYTSTSEVVHTEANDISAATAGPFKPERKSFKEVHHHHQTATQIVRRAEVQDQLASRNAENSLYHQVKGTIVSLPFDNNIYRACPIPECDKKVIRNDDDATYRCEKCSKNFPHFKYRFFFNMVLRDCSSRQWVSVFNNEAEKILGMTAEEASKDSRLHRKAVTDAHHKEFIFTLRAKAETYNDKQRLKIVVIRVDPIDPPK